MTSAPSSPSSYAATPRTTPTRNRDRAHHDTETVHAILDSEWLCHLGFVADDGPVVLPTLYARIGGRLYLHGSTGSRVLRTAGAGLPVCVTVTRTDGIVLARSGMHHSINYRSAVVHGTAHRVTDPDEVRTALDAVIDNVVPGRSGDCRPPNAKELAQTAVIRVDLDEASAKTRSGGVDEEPDDADLPHWAGVIPLTHGYGAPEPDTDGSADASLPDYLRRLVDG